jgi:hypothetical protein
MLLPEEAPAIEADASDEGRTDDASNSESSS